MIRCPDPLPAAFVNADTYPSRLPTVRVSDDDGFPLMFCPSGHVKSA